MRHKYSNSNVKNCRDHCGPGFSGSMLMEDIYKTIETDIENRFDLIHVDLCHYQGTNKERLYESKKAIEHCLHLNNEIALEIGTDENVGSMYSINSLEEIQQELDFFKSFSNPDFYVVQTGSLVKEINQVGSLNKSFLIGLNKIINENDVKAAQIDQEAIPTSNRYSPKRKLIVFLGIIFGIFLSLIYIFFGIIFYRSKT